MKKTHTKAFANLIASILLLCIEGWALFQTYGFKVVKKATVQPAAFPQIMCVGMIIFTVILLIQSIIKLISMSDDDPLAEPAASINFIKNKALDLVLPDGFVSICIYPGHEEGARELHALLNWAAGLDVRAYNVLHHDFIAAKAGTPHLILIQKNG